MSDSSLSLSRPEIPYAVRNEDCGKRGEGACESAKRQILIGDRCVAPANCNDNINDNINCLFLFLS